MILYSGTTCPFSHRCRIVLYEKGMDFQINDVDLHGKKNFLSVMNPYNRTPVLVERDLILYESNIINEYIDDRFPHPQLMPADPISKSRARLFLFRFENEIFSNIDFLEKVLINKILMLKSLLEIVFCRLLQFLASKIIF